MRHQVLLLAAALAPCFCAETALDRYVAAPDPTYRWDLVSQSDVGGAKVSILDMKSQTWRSAAEVDRTVWQHWVTIIQPQARKSTTGLLFITGGANGRPRPSRPDPMLLQIAQDTGMVVTELRNVPNQPIFFKDESRPKGRVEDELISYTWDKFLRGGDELWPARLPMTKAAVRAMDATTEFCRGAAGGGAVVDRFVVAGASKRGWTTWTTAAVDKRVVAIAPLVIDMLNIVPSFLHHWRVYGFWAPAIQDYVDMGITNWFERPEYARLMKIEEPYEYRSRLTMPKLMINSAGDEFFLPDSSQFYYDGLPGEKHLRYVPNTRHNLSPSDVPQTLTAFLDDVISNRARPQYSWKIRKSGEIEVTPKDEPLEVRLWQVTNPSARDFRLTTTGANWKSEVLAKSGRKYVARVSRPPQGYTAYFVELTYQSGGRHRHKFTTGVKVAPDSYPFSRASVPKGPTASNKARRP